MLCRFIGLYVLTGVFFVGCSGSEQEPQQPPAETAGALDGHWLLSITQQYEPGDYRNVSTVLLEIQTKEGKPQAKVVGSKPALPRARLKSFEVEGDQMHIALASSGYPFDFVGTIDGETVRGTMDQGSFLTEPALLVKQKIRQVSDAPDFVLPDNYFDHQKLLLDIQKKKEGNVSPYDFYEPFQAFAKAHPESPLSIILYHALSDMLPKKAANTAEVEEFAQSYLKLAEIWGRRMQIFARFHLAKNLAEEPRFAKRSLEYLKQIESQLDPDRRDEVRPELEYYRQMAETSLTRHKAQQAFAEAVAGDAEAMSTLREYSGNSPFDPVLMYLRAEAARRTGQADEALKYHARIAVWPRLETTLRSEPIWQEGDRKLPEGQMLELWAKKHGSDKGLEQYKLKVYEEALDLIARQIGEPGVSEAGNRLNVMELFTGTNCPPCLGADLATAGLEKLLPSQLLVLRYHLHTNGLDPLVNPHNMERFDALLGPNPQGPIGTPSVFINGKPAGSSVGGFLDNAPPIGSSLLAELRPTLSDDTPLKLELSAYQNNGDISATAKLTGVPEGLRDKLRVHLLLAEAQLDYPAPNGVRRHEMLVRWFFQQGSSFALPETGDFQTSAKTSLREIRSYLDTQTRSAALQMNAEVGTIPLELVGLRFVALVHRADTGEILQAGTAPVKVYDTKPGEPKLPMPTLPEPEPATGPLLVPPSAGKKPPKSKNSPDPQPAQAEKPESGE